MSQQEIQSLKEFISNLIKNDLIPNLGEEHPITIQYENDLAHILFLQGNYKEAILIKEKLLESSKKIYGTVSSSNLAESERTACRLWQLPFGGEQALCGTSQSR